MGNVKWHVSFVSSFWNVAKTDWIMLICVQHGNLLAEVISIMWIQLKWEPPGLRRLKNAFFFFFFVLNKRWCGKVEHNAAAITIHLLIPSWTPQGGGTPHAALPEVSWSSAATILWSLVNSHASQQQGLGWVGLVETTYYLNNDDPSSKCQETAICGGMLLENQQISWPQSVFNSELGVQSLVWFVGLETLVRNTDIHLHKAYTGIIHLVIEYITMHTCRVI